jgi:hypothetical protein
MPDGRSVQIGWIGCEGLVGLFDIYGFGDAMTHYSVTIPARALRIPMPALREFVAQEPLLREAIHKYTFYRSVMIGQMSACNRLHTLTRRLCSHLLLVEDNAAGERLPLSHEVLSNLLGVQRPSITMIAGELRKSGLIEYSHGRIAIRGRSKIEKRACECYSLLRVLLEKNFPPAGERKQGTPP